MGLELNILPVNPDTAETSPENYFMFCLYSSLWNCVAGKILPKLNKSEVH